MSVTPDYACTEISSYTESLIRTNGYPLEILKVTTEDGYINTLYHIPHSPSEVEKQAKGRRIPVLLVHGLISSAAESLLEKRQLGFYLSNEGYDVWIANCRGTTFSREHVKYNHITDADKYWNFSFHEIGYYDLAAFIDFILERTGFSKLLYTGVSQGCSSLAVLLSTRREYNEKIALACFMCPAVIFENASKFPAKFLFVHVVPWIKWIRDKLGLETCEVPFTHTLRSFGSKFAQPGSFGAWFLLRVWSIFGGHYNPELSEMIDFRKVSKTSPNTACFKQMLHFSQVIKDNRFGWYDYGSTANERRYGTQKPPDYDLSAISAPVALFYSKNDMFFAEKDMIGLSKKLGNCVHLHSVRHDKFNHIDFVVNENVIPLVYKHVLDVMQKYKD